jgi:hypothetical protein
VPIGFDMAETFGDFVSRWGSVAVVMETRQECVEVCVSRSSGQML